MVVVGGNYLKYLFFNPLTLWHTHLARELQLIKSLSEEVSSESIHYIVCNRGMYSCSPNIHNLYMTCFKCSSIRKKLNIFFLKELKLKKVWYEKFEFSLNISKQLLKDCNSIEDFKKIKFNNVNVGREALSTLISYFRNPSIEFENDNKILLTKLLMTSVNTIFFLNKLFKEYSYDTVFVPNGRVTPTRTIFELCQLNNVRCIIYEVGNNLNYYELYKNEMVHKFGSNEKRIEEFWVKSNESLDKKIQIGSTFFIEKAKGNDEFSYINNQERGSLPFGWNKLKKNISIFTSSDDEYASISEDWDQKLYKNQYEGITKIISSLLEYKSFVTDCHIYIRMHPNLTDVHNYETDSIRNLEFPSVTVIQPEEKIDTYAVLMESDVILTFGSTIGIEAVFWGKVSLLASPAIYSKLFNDIMPETHDQLINLLMSEQFPFKDKTQALKYVYYYASFGQYLKDCKIISLKEVYFKGKNLESCLGIKFWLVDFIYKLSENILGKNMLLRLKMKLGL